MSMNIRQRSHPRASSMRRTTNPSRAPGALVASVRVSALVCWILLTAGACTGAQGTLGSPSDPELTSISLSPESALLLPGEDVQFSAVAHASDGSSAPATVTYSASGGTITASGLFTAGTSAGEYRVIATHEASQFKDTSLVSIEVIPDGSADVNECATPDAAWLWCDDFEEDRLADYFEYDAAGGSFARASGVGRDGSLGMRARFASGQQSAGALHLAIGKTPQAYFRPVDEGTAIHRDVYWRLYLRHEPGWTGGGADKLSRATSFASTTSWAQAMIAHVWSGAAPEHEYLVLDPASGTDASGSLQTTTYNDFANLRWLGIERADTPIFDAAHVGAWYCIEAHVRLNDAGQSNGVFELWIDDQLEASTSGMNWIGSFSAYGINAVFFENYWNSGSPRAQERYFDNIIVSSERIGC